MPYVTTNPPALISQLVGKTGGKQWVYDSADAALVVRGAGYITNADDLGMAVGDIVDQIDSTGATVAHRYVVNSVTAGGAADLTDGTAVTLTDTD